MCHFGSKVLLLQNGNIQPDMEIRLKTVCTKYTGTLTPRQKVSKRPTPNPLGILHTYRLTTFWPPCISTHPLGIRRERAACLCPPGLASTTLQQHSSSSEQPVSFGLAYQYRRYPPSSTPSSSPNGRKLSTGKTSAPGASPASQGALFDSRSRKRRRPATRSRDSRAPGRSTTATS